MKLKATILRFWHDPVWSIVISSGIIALIVYLFTQLSVFANSMLSIIMTTFVIVGIVLIVGIFLVIWYKKRDKLKQKSEKESQQNQQISDSALTFPIPGNIPRDCLPTFQTAESIETLRQNTGVRSLTDEENQLTLWELPDGVLGYIEAYKIDTPEWRIIDQSDVDKNFNINKSMSLYQRPLWDGCVEIHKSKDGHIYLISFVTEEDRIVLQNPSRPKAVNVTISLSKTPKRTNVIAIPRERLVYWRQRILGNGEYVGDALIS